MLPLCKFTRIRYTPTLTFCTHKFIYQIPNYTFNITHFTLTLSIMRSKLLLCSSSHLQWTFFNIQYIAFSSAGCAHIDFSFTIFKLHIQLIHSALHDYIKFTCIRVFSPAITLHIHHLHRYIYIAAMSACYHSANWATLGHGYIRNATIMHSQFSYSTFIKSHI